MSRVIRILLLAARLEGCAQLAFDHEVAAIDAEMRASLFRDRWQLITKYAMSADALPRALLWHQPHVVHLSGHGRPNALLFAHRHLDWQSISAAALVHVFGVLGEHSRLVVLHSCYSDTHARALVEHVDFAIGMRQGMRDDAFVAFARGLYMALGHGCSIQKSFDVGVTALILRGMEEFDSPVLYSRNGVDATRCALLPGD